MPETATIKPAAGAMSPELEALFRTHGEIWSLHRPSLGRFTKGPEEAAIKATPRIPRVKGSVAIIPVTGVITHRGYEDWYSSHRGTRSIGRAIDAAVSDDSIGGIVLDVDSPGGTIHGTAELSDKIYAARERKPIVAVANCLMASAAYWIGSSASQVVGSPTSDIGSVGVWTMHVDATEFWKQMGLDVTLISAGKYKVEGNEYEPLSEEAREAFQRSVDASYDMFVSALARNRGVAKSKVISDFGEGRVLSASDAKEAGMIDRIATLDEVVASMMGSSPTASTGQRSEHLLLAAWDEREEPEGFQQVAEASEGAHIEAVKSRRLRRERQNGGV